MNIDFIGDIHGNYQKLNKLLELMDYNWSKEEHSFVNKHDRKICVLGDFINVGVENEKVLDLLYIMHSKKQAYLIVGNNEYFISLLYKRVSTNKNLFWSYLYKNYFTIYQEFVHKKEKLYFFLDWINTLPIFLEFNGVKVVHAYWEDNIINKLRSINNIKSVIEKTSNDASLIDDVNKTLMGIIYKYIDESQNRTIYFRYRWWDYDKGLPLKNMFIHESEKLPNNEVEKIKKDMLNFSIGNYIVFFGHYNLKGFPHLTNPLRCCLDYGGAKGGYLTAYRWNGENILNKSNLIWV